MGSLLVVLALMVAVLAGAGPPPACYCIGSPPEPGVAAGYQLVVVDPDEAGREVLEAVHGSGGVVLAYVNIGYAEEWRSYWSNVSAAGIVHGWAGYEGEYFVEYWDSLWRSVLRGIVARALSKGFDGVYLDNVDAYLVLLEQGSPAWAEGVDLRAEMIGLVGELAGYAEVLGPGALVYVNLGGAAVDLRGGLGLHGVDGVLREEALLVLEARCVSALADMGEALEVLGVLAEARRAGLDVVVVEFVDYPWEAVGLKALYGSMGFRVVLQDACDPDYTRPPLSITEPFRLAALLADDLGLGGG